MMFIAISSSQGFSLNPPPFYIPKIRTCQEMKSFYTRVGQGVIISLETSPILLVLVDYLAKTYGFPVIRDREKLKKKKC